MNPRQVLLRLEQLVGAYDPPRRLSDIVEAELIDSGLSQLRAAEIVEARTISVIQLILRKEEESHQAGTLYPLSLAPSTDFVAGSCYALPTDSPEVARLKAQRGAAGQILAAMRALSFRQFESFGARVLKELGAKNPHVTPRSNDQGIDFYGELSLGELNGTPVPFFRLAHDVRLKFVGQAKHYPNSAMGPDVVRELVGAMSLARTRTFSDEKLDLFDRLEIRPFSPILALLFTTGELSSGAAHLASQAGVVARSGPQLAVFLAEKGVGIRLVGAQQTFDAVAFAEWITGTNVLLDEH